MLLTLAAALLLLGIVIFVHELGHFLAAKAVGIGVPRFSIGFGNPTPLRVQWGETEYVVSWVPLGGYVKMATREDEIAGVSALEGGGAEHFPPEKLFENKPLWARIVVLSAGVTMNALLAWGVYTGIAISVGGVEDTTTSLAEVQDSILPPSAVALAGLPFGATVTHVNGDTVTAWNDILEAITDVSSDRLRFDFAGGIDPVILPIPGTAATERVDVYRALRPLHPARIGSVGIGLPAARAGIEPGDLVVRIGADSVRYWGDLLDAVEPAMGDTLLFVVLRGDQAIELPVVPDTVSESVRDPTTGSDREIGYIGVGQQLDLRRVEYGFFGAVGEGWGQTVRGVTQVVFTVRGLILGRVSPKELGGPIIIGQLSGEFARAGPTAFLAFLAFISINLAIFNLLPIPVLDGGHLVFLVLEGLRGKPVSLNIRLRFTQVGMALLLALVVFIVFNDVARIVGG